jgi:acetolactate synthase-1/2/3 large subunit
MTQAEPVTGAEFLARSLAANSSSYVVFVDAVRRHRAPEPRLAGTA